MSEINIQQDDLDLARAATGGDEIAWRRIYDETNQQLYNFLCYQTGDRDAARDLMQETYVTALRRLDTYRGQGTLLSWLRAVGLRKCLDWRRRVSLRHAQAGGLRPRTYLPCCNRRGGDVPRPGRWFSGGVGSPVAQATGRASPPRTRGPAVRRNRRDPRLRRGHGPGPPPPGVPQHEDSGSTTATISCSAATRGEAS